MVSHSGGWTIAEMAVELAVLSHNSVLAAITLGTASIFGSTLGAPVPAQSGVIESALVPAGSLVGLSAATVLSVALLRRLRSACWILIGAVGAIGLSKARSSMEPKASSTHSCGS